MWKKWSVHIHKKTFHVLCCLRYFLLCSHGNQSVSFFPFSVVYATSVDLDLQALEKSEKKKAKQEKIYLKINGCEPEKGNET